MSVRTHIDGKGGMIMLYKHLSIITVVTVCHGLVFGQAINVKTIPLIMTDQLSMMPSYNAGMGGVNIGLDDALADGFNNPARLHAAKNNFMYVAPYRDSWSDRQVQTGGRCCRQINTLQGSMVQGLPGGFVRHDALAGGKMIVSSALALSVEQLRHTSRSQEFWDPDLRDWNRALQMNKANWPRSGVLAVRFPDRGLSVGLGVDQADLYAVDGIPLLYPGARELQQSGEVIQYRLGASLDLGQEDRIDLLLFHKNYRMTQLAIFDWKANLRNSDEEQSWLGQLKFRRQIEENAQIGVELTAQRKWHPKIPDYPAPEIRIPRDPGITNALRIGLGFSQREGKTTVAMDASMEIIDSKTWGDTTAAVMGFDGQIIEAGEPTFSNDYFFNNVILRLGIQYQATEKVRLQGGWYVRQYTMDFYHEDFRSGETVTASPQNMWKEPALTGGVVVKLGNIEWLYQTSRRKIAGSQRQQELPSWFRGWGIEDMWVKAGGDILAPPTVTGFAEVPIVMHRLTLLFWL